MADSARTLEMQPYPEDRFVEAVHQVLAANASWVPLWKRCKFIPAPNLDWYWSNDHRLASSRIHLCHLRHSGGSLFPRRDEAGSFHGVCLGPRST